MSEKKGHFGSKALGELHKDVKDLDNGACLTGHKSSFTRFRNKTSCNYRYQAYEQALSEPRIKNQLESYKSKSITGPIKTSAYETKSGKMSPSYYCAVLQPPQAGDWDIKGPNRIIARSNFNKNAVRIPENHNFTQDTWPYWNNAHHIIPKGTLKAMILAARPVEELIQQALLQAKYNVNYKLNMLLMPQDREVARLLGLPRHLQLREDDAPGLSDACTNHPIYNDMVESKLTPVINAYKEDCAKAQKKATGHKVPKVELDKTRLENVSKSLLDWILGSPAEAKTSRGRKRRQPSSGGESLDERARKRPRT